MEELECVSLWDSWPAQLEGALKFNLGLVQPPILQCTQHAIIQPALEYPHWQDTRSTPYSAFHFVQLWLLERDFLNWVDIYFFAFWD